MNPPHFLYQVDDYSTLSIQFNQTKRDTTSHSLSRTLDKGICNSEKQIYIQKIEKLEKKNKEIKEKYCELLKILQAKDHRISQLLIQRDDKSTKDQSSCELSEEKLSKNDEEINKEENKANELKACEENKEVFNGVQSEEDLKINSSFNLSRKSLKESSHIETKNNFRILYTKSLKFASEYDQQVVREFKDKINQAKNWKVIRQNLNTYKLIFRKFDDPETGIPIFHMQGEIEDVHPLQFWRLFDEKLTRQNEWNAHCEITEGCIGDNGESYFRTRLKMPIISNREFVDRRTLIFDETNGVYYIIFKQADDDPKVEENFPVHKKYVRGINHIMGYMLKPLNEGKGMQFEQLTQPDIKGNIPKYLVTKLTPAGGYEFICSIAKMLQKETFQE